MRCIRDKGRFAKHDIIRSDMQWWCNRCGLVVPTILLEATRNLAPLKIPALLEYNEIIGDADLFKAIA